MHATETIEHREHLKRSLKAYQARQDATRDPVEDRDLGRIITRLWREYCVCGGDKYHYNDLPRSAVRRRAK